MVMIKKVISHKYSKINQSKVKLIPLITLSKKIKTKK